MPYITKEQRKILDKKTKPLKVFMQDGELNYVITSIIHAQIHARPFNYTNLNAMIGVLECAKAELYAVVVRPYESKKRMENGPVSELDAKTLEDVR